MKKAFGAGIVLAMIVSAWGQDEMREEGGFDFPGAVGPELTQFEWPDSVAAARWYNGFTASFFTNRIDIGPTIFPREYLAISDAWLNDAFCEGSTIQAHTRDSLLADRMDAEGYVFSRQHGASSHDHGWPFPHWIQVPGEEGWRGVTAGWHFYDNPLVWEIVYSAARKSAPEQFGEAALSSWETTGFKSVGINADKRAWELVNTDGFPTMTSPEGVTLEAFNAPYIQIRWNMTGDAAAAQPYMEWMCEGDADWSESRRMNFYPDWLDERSDGDADQATGMFHSILPLHSHPEWKGKIKRIRFCMSASEVKGQTFYVRSIFSHWDTRHLVNNAIYVKAAFEYFRWTGDTGFLREIMPNLRMAMRYMMEEGHGLELNYIRCTFHGHDARPGYIVNADGSKSWKTGHGKGGNYWDLLPLGWDDMYTTTHYYAALLAMAQLEEAIAQNPGWAVPRGFLSLEPSFLNQHAAKVKDVTNTKFFDPAAGRFVGCIDADGVKRDYGFAFINLEAVHYGIVNEANAKQVMEWIDGTRVVEGDTSTGEDIYRYRLAPRATTKRNVEWYAHMWPMPENIPFGGQVQDGGAVLGFSFYDLMSRIKTLGADNAWKRLMEIRAWDEEVAAYGGYRKYYGDGKGGTTLQGGGTAGGVGIDFEFKESSMLAAVVPLGFMGLRPDGRVLQIEPKLPEACPRMTVRNLKYLGIPVDITVSENQVEVVAHQQPAQTITVRFKNEELIIKDAGTYQLPK